MEADQLLDAIERYLNGIMSAEERSVFEELRKTNPEVDQLVVEQAFFLNRLNYLGEQRKLKYEIQQVELKLENEGILQLKQGKGKAKIIHLWRRYRRTITVAAAIAGMVSLFTAATISYYSENKKASVITPLVDNKINQLEHKLNQMETKLNDATASIPPKFEANFRATGFLLDGEGYIITNAHVVSNANNLIVENHEGRQYRAVPLYANKLNDIAILKIIDTTFEKVSNLPYTFPTHTADLAEPIFTLGFPREEVVYGEGYLSAQSGYFGDTTSYQISISVNPGNSGGPVINKNGQVIGIISSKETNADGVVFAIKSKNIFNAVDALEERDSTINIQLPDYNTLKGLSRVQQIRKLENFVYKVKGN